MSLAEAAFASDCSSAPGGSIRETSRAAAGTSASLVILGPLEAEPVAWASGESFTTTLAFEREDILFFSLENPNFDPALLP